MGTFIMIVQLLTGLGLLVLLHEFGHFITARMFKIRVDKFYLFFDFLFPLPGVLNFAIFKKKVGDTEYGLGWFPMGGYVQIAGMIDESLDTEQMNKPAEPWEFRAHPAWQRLIVMLGGIIVNVLLAFLIYAMVLFVWGDKKIPLSSLKDGIACNDSLGNAVGFRTGDKIIAIDGKPVKYYNDLRFEILLGHNVQVERSGEIVEFSLPQDFIDKLGKTERYNFVDFRRPAFIEFDNKSVNKKVDIRPTDRIVGINDSIKIVYYDELQSQLKNFKNENVFLNLNRDNQIIKVEVKVNQNSRIGAILLDVPEKELEEMAIIGFERRTYGFFESFPAGVNLTYVQLQKYVRQAKLMLSPSTGAYKQIGGFGSMAKMYGKTWDWEEFWTKTGFLSIVLAFMNLLPIPALDGGHVVFTLYEMITGRAPSVKVLTYAQYIGMAILLALMLYANLNDIFKPFK